jgi:hypothetical protein
VDMAPLKSPPNFKFWFLFSTSTFVMPKPSYVNTPNQCCLLVCHCTIMCHECMFIFLSPIFVFRKGKMACEVAPHVFLNCVELGLSEPKKKKKGVEHGL